MFLQVAKDLTLLQLRESFYLPGQKHFSFQLPHKKKMLMPCHNFDPVTTYGCKERGL